MQDKTKVLLIVQDECHWGIRDGGHVSVYINNPAFMDAQNVYLLHVSATPENVLVTPKMIDENVIRWDKVLEEQVRLALIIPRMPTNA